MIGYVQWATDPASSWDQVSILSDNDWRGLDKKDEPAGGEVLDTTKGWVQAVMCQGVTLMSMDHYALLPDGGALQMFGWNDDPVDWATPWGVIWTFMLPTVDGTLRPPQVNTRQSLDVYGTTSFYPDDGTLSTTTGPATFHPWADFPEPRANLTKHGIWVPSDCENCAHTEDDHGKAASGDACDFADCVGYASLHRRHKDAIIAEPHGWREWAGAG